MSIFATEKAWNAMEKVSFRWVAVPGFPQAASAMAVVAMIEWLAERSQESSEFRITRKDGRWAISESIADFMAFFSATDAPALAEALIEAVVATPAPEVGREGEKRT